MVHPARQIADFGVQRAAHCHIHLLKAPADAQKRLAAFHAGLYQRQGDRITATVKRAMGGGFILTIGAGVHIGPPARQQKAVAQVQQFGHRHKARIGRNHQRHRPRHA